MDAPAHPHYDLNAGPAPIEVPEPGPAPLFTVRLVYKSGFVQDIVTDAFQITKGKKVAWGNYCVPRPLLLGIDDIAAVFQMDQLTDPQENRSA